eukprot:CAMPEP_0203767104 /NCGR_PEP_ID=MMETSP0099_2-20121227/803_1 /ASSEMBLY_ACC=CAM_ASM_000209 /TAXON_ID=96639 /ORGANISM=" , Strain NY0313808BC1" /LENGTH=210 /DNA_ID=CAMNT_0050663559 /DNA_START=227 /DNA_END=859 /DNA_ORIENTATION=-
MSDKADAGAVVGQDVAADGFAHGGVARQRVEQTKENLIAANQYEAQREVRLENAVQESVIVGMKAFVATGIVSSGTTYWALQRFPKFASSLGTSGRVAVAFMPALFAFTFASETMASKRAHPDAYLPQEDTSTNSKHAPVASTGFFFSNISPLKGLMMVGIPLVGGVFYLNGRNSHLTFSQRVMHTRVMGQASILALLGSYAIYDFSKRI